MYTDRELRILRAAYHSLREQREFLRERIARNHTTMDPGAFEALAAELAELHAAFPELLPTLNRKATEFESSYEGILYRSDVVIPYLSRVIARIEIEIDQPASSPVIQTREFPFVRDPEIRAIVERDYIELQRAFVAACWKSVMVLSGGLIEAILLDRLAADAPLAKSAGSSPSESDLSRWSLDSLIKVSIELKLITPAAEKLSHSIREYRNLVHPGREARHRLTVAIEEARIAIEVLHILHRDLGR